MSSLCGFQNGEGMISSSDISSGSSLQRRVRAGVGRAALPSAVCPCWSRWLSEPAPRVAQRTGAGKCNPSRYLLQLGTVTVLQTARCTMGSSPLGNLCYFTGCFTQPSKLKNKSGSPGCLGMILCFSVVCVFYPGVFCVPVLLHLLAKTIYQNSLTLH